MKKIYNILLIPSLLLCSDNPGKLPKDFKFKEQADGVAVRISFMKQYKEYEDAQIQLRPGQQLTVNITTPIQADAKKKDDHA